MVWMGKKQMCTSKGKKTPRTSAARKSKEGGKGHGKGNASKCCNSRAQTHMQPVSSCRSRSSLLLLLKRRRADILHRCYVCTVDERQTQQCPHVHGGGGGDKRGRDRETTAHHGTVKGKCWGVAGVADLREKAREKKGQEE